LIITYKVFLPKWVFESDKEVEIEENIKIYLQRYPQYVFIREENGFAICEHI